MQLLPHLIYTANGRIYRCEEKENDMEGEMKKIIESFKIWRLTHIHHDEDKLYSKTTYIISLREGPLIFLKYALKQ